MSLDVIESRLMLEIARGPGDALRIEFVRARTPEGKEVAWHTVSAGGKQVTVRGRELHRVVIALLRAVASSIPAELHDAAKRIVAALEGVRS